MNLRRFLELKSENTKRKEYTQFTFTVMKAVKDEPTPFYHFEYYQTPIRDIKDWLEGSAIENYIIVTPDSMPIDITGCWCNWYKRGELVCCIVTTVEALELKYKDKDQLKRILESYDKNAKDHFDDVSLYFEV